MTPDLQEYIEHQSIFVKYLIWNERLQKVNKLCCENHPVKKLNHLQKIQWSLICSVNSIENGQRQAFKMVNYKKVELSLIKDNNGRYLNPPFDQINAQLLAYVGELTLTDSNAYADFKELLMHAYDLLKLKQ